MVLSIPNTLPDRLARLRTLARESLPRRPVSPRLHTWRMLTLPLWWGSDIPPPMLPEIRNTGTHHATGDMLPADQYLYGQLRGLQRRFWISWWSSSILRGCSLGALLTLLWVLLAPVTPLAAPATRSIVICILLGAIPGIIFGWVNRPSVHRIAAMIDRTYELDERLVTAIDQRERGSHEYETMQVADAANALADIRREIRLFSFLPVRESILLMVIGAMIVAIFTFALDASGVAPAGDVLVPGYYPASERLANRAGPLPGIPTPAPATAPGDDTDTPTSTTSGKNDDQKNLGELGKAFDQHDLTRQVANDLAKGDVAAAASSLDAAAGNIASASQEDRNALADDLDSAAGAMSDSNGDLASQTRKTASDIRAGGDRANQGSKDLAREIGKKAPPESPEQQGNAGSAGSAGQAPVGEQGQGANQPGGSSSSSSSGELEPSSSQPDPGSGAEAAPGIAEQEAGQDEGQSGQAGGASGSTAGSAGESGDPNDPANQDGSGNGNAQQGDPSAGNGSSDSNASQDDQQASRGSGAGSGEAEDADSPPGASNQSESDAENNPDAPENVEEGQPSASVGQTDGQGGDITGSGSNTLIIGGASDDTVQAGNDIGSASLGSGSAAAGAASGDAQSQPVGPAGPDSNHVPADVEDVVRNYFSEPAP